jgi:hypothetical protein
MAALTTPTVILIVLYKIRLARRKWKKKEASLLVESTVERDWRYLYIVDKSSALLLLLLAEEK